jgi:RNA polymerase sigma-70 factor (ECF subfamily)
MLLDPSDAEDVVHDVFVTFFRRPGCFDPERGSSRAWLLTVVRNRSLDRLRRRATHPRADLNSVADHLVDPNAADALDELHTAAQAEVLWRLVDALPRNQADLIRRAFVNGRTHQEIAEDTGLPLGTVKSRIRLGLDKLRGALRTATLADIDC